MIDEANRRLIEARRTKAKLGQALWTHRDTVAKASRPQLMSWVEIPDLEVIEARAEKAPGDKIATLHSEMLSLLSSGDLATDPAQRERFKAFYDEARAIILPATIAYLRHQHQLLNFSRNHSLAAVDLETLRSLDLLAFDDPSFAGFTRQLAGKLGPKVTSPDVVAYSQFFEVYGEAITLQFLRSRPGLKVKRVDESSVPGESRPDFQCEFDDGRVFFVEVKTLDIVGGEFRHDEMMREALLGQDDIQAQIAKGKSVAFSETVIDPYRKLGQTKGYDPRSLILPIDTLREKLRGAFKPSQFALGPTFALAIVDRLIVPGHRNALAAYYYEPLYGGACVNGVLWHTAFGTIGAPVFRTPDFEGKPTLEGHLKSDGLYTDQHQPFPGVGLIVLATDGGARVAYGLAAPQPDSGDWTSDQTEEALEAVCGDAHNDGRNSFAYNLAHADQARGEVGGAAPA